MALCSTKDLDTPFVRIHSWEGLLQTQQTSSRAIQCNCYSHVKISVFCSHPCFEFNNKGVGLSMRVSFVDESQSYILVRALEVTDQGWAQPLTRLAVLHPAHAGSWGRKLGQDWDLAAIAMNAFTPSFWLQCFTFLLIGQEITLLLIHCPLSETNNFVIIQPWFWKELLKNHKSPKSKNSTNTLLLRNYFPRSIYFISEGLHGWKVKSKIT